MEDVGTLRQENSTLRRTNEELAGGTEPSHNKHAEPQHISEIGTAEKERCKMHLELLELGDKYAKMVK